MLHSYHSLLQLAEDLGKPKPEDLTPFEFLRELPEPLGTLREAAVGLTALYAQAYYSAPREDYEISDEQWEILKSFWKKLDKTLRKYVR